MNELVPLWRRAITAEVCWLDEAGEPAALAVTPLLAGSTPCVAVPYARAAEVASLRRASRVAFAVTDSRSLRPGRPGALWSGSVEVADDTSGDFFATELLRQELAKYPPSRTLADSPLLCRENWWWLPRIVVRLTGAAAGPELPARTNPARHALLVRERDAELAVDVVDVDDLTRRRVPLRRLDGGTVRGDGAPGLLLGYDYSIPDLERWEPWSARGTVLGEELAVTARAGEPGAELAPLRLLQRIRRQRLLASRCKQGILDAERASAG
ncbi:hypothetical protein [Prauserella muralis]|uniref:Uncharacterized protein n=1 Tax=Prauserella muralis TaxID=588067 RepID=A0A2V4B331_9PSEU|nr:hypothetical protein [Prauserella muralis]PXY27555.1 hypothetical protein BAY60_14170 [Prauserella muralis]TWE22722.1 hypothetical protein FHX69_3973 [Prauserella muralis]